MFRRQLVAELPRDIFDGVEYVFFKDCDGSLFRGGHGGGAQVGTEEG